MAISLLIITILLLAIAQIVQKLASRHFVGTGELKTAIRMLFFSFDFWLAALLLACALVTWLCTLTVFELSKAYPLLSVSYVLVAFLSRLFLHEKISRGRWLGIGLITAGAAIMLSAQ